MAASKELGFKKPIIKEDTELKEVWLIFSLEKETDRKTNQSDQKTALSDQKTDRKSDLSDQETDRKDRLSKKLIDLINSDPKMSRAKMAKFLCIHDSFVKRLLANLTKEGKIRREGPDKGGSWIILN